MLLHDQSTRLRRRRGVTLVESAVTLSITVLMLVALMDLGLATLQFNGLGHACRVLARAAATRGAESAGFGGTVLGPTTLAGNAGDGSAAAAVFASQLPTMQAAAVSYTVNWPDGDNGAGDRVHVTLRYTHQPLAPGLNFWGALPLTASSTMSIVN